MHIPVGLTDWSFAKRKTMMMVHFFFFFWYKFWCKYYWLMNASTTRTKYFFILIFLCGCFGPSVVLTIFFLFLWIRKTKHLFMMMAHYTTLHYTDWCKRICLTDWSFVWRKTALKMAHFTQVKYLKISSYFSLSLFFFWYKFW